MDASGLFKPTTQAKQKEEAKNPSPTHLCHFLETDEN
jgi:hypothetical protein